MLLCLRTGVPDLPIVKLSINSYVYLDLCGISHSNFFQDGSIYCWDLCVDLKNDLLSNDLKPNEPIEVWNYHTGMFTLFFFQFPLNFF